MERRLAAILAVDMVGYSRLMGKDEAGTLKTLKTHRKELFEPKEAQYHGRTIKLMGDGALMEFGSVVEAIAFAVEIQCAMAERNAGVPEDRQNHYRIGVNIGDIIVEGDDIYGDGVNIAARLEGLADPGGICISRPVYTQIKGKLDLTFENLGEKQVKNIADPVTVYRVALDDKAAALVTPVVAATARVTPFKRWQIAAALAVCLTVMGGLVWWQPWAPKLAPAPPEITARPLPDKPSIAVLPFTNLSDDSSQEYFADGLTDDLITDLSKISGLFVIARNTVFTYKGRAVDIREVARKLGVRYVLEGSVRRAGDRIRINAQLIDSETGGHLWADRFDRDASDVFAVQDEVVRRIADTLAVQLSASEQQRLERLPTTNLEAYDYYLRAEQAARTGFRPQLHEALRLYEKAMALDPSFAQAFAADARTAAYVMRNNYDDVLQWPVARKRAYEHASEALEIDPEAPLPFAVLAALQVVDGRHAEALASAERAVALGPSEAEAHAALILVLTFSSRHADAVAAIETAVRLNPSLSTGDSIVAGLAFLLNDQPERAIDVLERARAEEPGVDDTHVMLAAAYTLAGRADTARSAAAEAVRLSPNLCVELYRVTLAHFDSDQDLAKILDALRAAGLPEWPYAFSADSRDRLTAAEINGLAFGRTWQGRVDGGGVALMQMKPKGDLVFRTMARIATGKASIFGDMLCERIEASSLGRPVCGPVYRHTASSGEDGLAYTYVNASKVFHFSPVE
jgi:TolB-like protein/class 3 adenylate cyclase/Tfp pilus assembly protein PilF